MYLLMLDMAARSMAGPDASLTPHERGLIDGPLARTLARHTGVSDRIAALADPLALLVGLALWGGRVMQIRAAQIESPAPARVQVAGADPTARTPEPPPPPRQTVVSSPVEPLATFAPAPAGDPISIVMEGINAAA